MIVRSNAIGIPLLAVIQGGIATLGYYLFDVPSALLFGFLTCFATVIPIVGTALVWFPLAAYLALSGDWTHAIGLLLYCGLIVTNIDNLIRFILQRRWQTPIHSSPFWSSHRTFFIRIHGCHIRTVIVIHLHFMREYFQDAILKIITLYIVDKHPPVVSSPFR